MGIVMFDQVFGVLDGIGMWVFWDLLVQLVFGVMLQVLDGNFDYIVNVEQIVVFIIVDLCICISFNFMFDVLQCNDFGFIDLCSFVQKIVDVCIYWVIGVFIFVDKCQYWLWLLVFDCCLELCIWVYVLMVQNEFDLFMLYLLVLKDWIIDGYVVWMVLVNNVVIYGVMFDDNVCIINVEFVYFNFGVMLVWDVVCQVNLMYFFVMQDVVIYEYGYFVVGFWLLFLLNIYQVNWVLVF